MSDTLKAGAAQVNISPKDSQFLLGYPHVERYSTGINDPLLSSALYLSDGKTNAIFITNDICLIAKDLIGRMRKKIEDATGVPAANIMITTTHTHSAPITISYISMDGDAIVPKPDEKYVQLMENGIVEAASKAFENACDAKLGLTVADDTGIGTNRRNPQGPADHNVPVLMIKSLDDKNIACMLICSMHPTVMHEDSKLVSADFPGFTRIYLQENVLGKDCPVLHHTGPSGNQSPRHVTKANTFAEAKRIGQILGKAVEKVLPSIKFNSDAELYTRQMLIADLPRKTFLTVTEAEAKLEKVVKKLEHMQNTSAPSQETRTVECDWFGAEESLTLAKAYQEGTLEKAYQSCLPAEIQIIKVGNCSFVGWQGELFIKYPLAVKAAMPNAFIVSLANGEFQGYIVTKEALEEGGYEASNGIFTYETGEILVKKTIEMLSELK